MAAELAELNRNAAASRDARSAIEVQRAEAHARVNFVRESCANELNQSLEEIARGADCPTGVRCWKPERTRVKNCASGWKTLAP